MPRIASPNGQTVVRGGRHSVHNRKACNTCRIRKGRCDGNGIDPCTWCSGKSQECNYNPEDGRGPSWNKQTMESHRQLEKNLLATNQALVAQVEAMQSYIRQMRSSNPQESTSFSSEQDELHALCEQTRHLVLQEGKLLALHGEWSPWVNIGVTRPTPASSPTAEIASPLVEEDHFDCRSAIFSTGEAWRRYLPENAVIDIVEHDRLCDLYFKFFASWGYRLVPRLFWRDMYQSLRSNASSSSSPSPQAPRTAHWSPFLHNALLSVALALSEKVEVRCRENRELFAKKAKDEMERECTSPMISTISGFSCLASFHSTQNEQSLAFMYYGISIRMCRALGLNVSCSQWVKTGHITKADEADRHWGFWMTYAQEIWWSLYVGREFSLNIAHIAIPLPSAETLPTDDTPWVLPGVDDLPRPNMYAETFVECCKLATIATNIMQIVYGIHRGSRDPKDTGLLDIHKELQEWYTSLPTTLTVTPISLPHVLMMHLAFWWCTMLLYRPSYKSATSPESTARKSCIRAAQAVSEIIDNWQSRYTLRCMPVSMMGIVFTAGTTWLLAASEAHAHEAEAQENYFNSARRCIGYLQHAEKLWESGKQLRIMLEKLVSEAIAGSDVVEQEGETTSAHSRNPSDAYTSSDDHPSNPKTSAQQGPFAFTPMNAVHFDPLPFPSHEPTLYASNGSAWPGSSAGHMLQGPFPFDGTSQYHPQPNPGWHGPQYYIPESDERSRENAFAPNHFY